MSTMTRQTRHQVILGFGLLAMVTGSFVQMSPRDMAWPALWSQEHAITDPTLAELQQRANMSLARLVQSGQIVE
jgi:hypothetical protein